MQALPATMPSHGIGSHVSPSYWSHHLALFYKAFKNVGELGCSGSSRHKSCNVGVTANHWSLVVSYHNDSLSNGHLHMIAELVHYKRKGKKR